MSEGVVIFKNECVVVRQQWNNGKLNVMVHHVVNGKEEIPRGYMLGSSALQFEPKTPFDRSKEAIAKLPADPKGWVKGR